ncbi:MAG: hypothetical protein QOI06_1676 [Nocardioidaceae bacterium]|nr:hypothetical protein [Nocardioidaceae bacterium]
MKLLKVDPDSPVAPFEQLRMQVAYMVVLGELEPGQRLPTVRQLANDLGLAPNTVARAYRELEADGVLSTRGSRGTFVRSAALEQIDDTKPDTRLTAAAFTSAARRNGLSLAEATRLLETAWHQKPSPG